MALYYIVVRKNIQSVPLDRRNIFCGCSGPPDPLRRWVIVNHDLRIAYSLKCSFKLSIARYMSFLTELLFFNPIMSVIS